MKRSIASIYYEPLTERRSYHPGAYSLPAIVRGSAPIIMVIEDQRQADEDIVHRTRLKRVIRGEVIATDLVKTWTENHPSMGTDCHPGIWVVRDVIGLNKKTVINGVEAEVPDVDADGVQMYREATKEEAARMFAEDLADAEVCQANWAEICIAQGDALALNPKMREKNLIPSYCYSACTYYGKSREWTKKLSSDQGQVCRYCAKTISALAVVCPECGNIVNAEEYKKLHDADAAVVGRALPPPLRPPGATKAA
jgi:hypothetical protein